jgi:hypothetical protein
MTDDVRRLLGGYATGTLTEPEKQLLYEAALHDEHLFNALANEQALKDLLDDPAARAQVLQATETLDFSIRAGLREWFSRPRAKALVATGAVLVVAIAISTHRDQQKMQVGQRSVSVAPTISAPLPAQREEPAAASKPRAAKPAPEKREAMTRLKIAPPAERRSQAVMISSSPAESFAAVTVSPPSLPFKYVLMKRSGSGEYEPVSADAEFSATDEVRVVVESAQAGTVSLVAENATMTSSGFVQPGKPATLQFPTAAHSARLSFAPLSRNLVTQSYASRETANQLSVEIKLNRK